MSEETPKKSHSVAQILGIGETPTILEPVRDDAQTDYEFVQKNIKDALAGGTAALDEMYQIAVASQSPRAFEVYGQLLEKLINGNRTLIEAKAKNAAIDTSERNTKQNITNNNLFVGSSKDAMAFIRKQKGGNNEETS